MKPDNASRAHESVLFLDVINKHRPFRFDAIDFRKLLYFVGLHDAAPLVFYRLKDHAGDIPEEVYERLRSRYLASTAMNSNFWNEFIKMSDAFRQSHVPLLPIKGIDILARFYPSFDLRNMSDIDILAREEDFEEVEKIFCSLGYTKNLEGLHQEYWKKHQCHIVFCKGNIRVDAHWSLDFKRKRRVLLPHLWTRTRTVDAGGHKIELLSPEDALFSFALHWRRYGHILSLKQVLDVARILRESPKFDWGYVIQEANRGRMKATLYFILMQACLFCGAEVPKTVLGDLKIPFWQKSLIKKFLLKNTFESQRAFKKNYLKAHFLLYDNVLEPVLYLMDIPYEQFCKFYDLKPYTRNADLRYRLRIPLMALSLFSGIFSKSVRPRP